MRIVTSIDSGCARVLKRMPGVGYVADPYSPRVTSEISSNAASPAHNSVIARNARFRMSVRISTLARERKGCDGVVWASGLPLGRGGLRGRPEAHTTRALNEKSR